MAGAQPHSPQCAPHLSAALPNPSGRPGPQALHWPGPEPSTTSPRRASSGPPGAGGRGPIRGPAFCIPRGDSSTVTLGVPGGQDPAPRPDLCWRLDTLEVRLRPALLVYSASRFSGLELGSPGRVGGLGTGRWGRRGPRRQAARERVGPGAKPPPSPAHLPHPVTCIRPLRGHPRAQPAPLPVRAHPRPPTGLSARCTEALDPVSRGLPGHGVRRTGRLQKAGVWVLVPRAWQAGGSASGPWSVELPPGASHPHGI